MQKTGFDPWVRKISWRRKWQPTPVFLPGKSHEQRSLMGCRGLWGHKESDMTVNKQQQQHVLSLAPKVSEMNPSDIVLFAAHVLSCLISLYIILPNYNDPFFSYWNPLNLFNSQVLCIAIAHHNIQKKSLPHTSQGLHFSCFLPLERLPYVAWCLMSENIILYVCLPF